MRCEKPAQGALVTEIRSLFQPSLACGSTDSSLRKPTAHERHARSVGKDGTAIPSVVDPGVQWVIGLRSCQNRDSSAPVTLHPVEQHGWTSVRNDIDICIEYSV